MPPKRSQSTKAQSTKTTKTTKPGPAKAQPVKGSRITKASSKSDVPATNTRSSRTRDRSHQLEQALTDVDNNFNLPNASENDPMNIDSDNEPMEVDAVENDATTSNDAPAASTNTTDAPTAIIPPAAVQEDTKPPHKYRWLCAVPNCDSGAYGFGELCKHYRKAHKNTTEPKKSDEIRKVPFIDWLNDEIDGFPATKQAKSSYPTFILGKSPEKVTETIQQPTVKQPSQPAEVNQTLQVPAWTEGSDWPPVTESSERSTLTESIEQPTAPGAVKNTDQATKPRVRFTSPEVNGAAAKPVELSQVDSSRLLVSSLLAANDLRDAQVQLEAARRAQDFYRASWDRKWEENQALLRLLARAGVDMTPYENDFRALMREAYQDSPNTLDAILRSDELTTRRNAIRAQTTLHRQQQPVNEELVEIPDDDDNRSEVLKSDFDNVEDANLGYNERMAAREWHIVKHSILGGKKKIVS